VLRGRIPRSSPSNQRQSFRGRPGLRFLLPLLLLVGLGGGAFWGGRVLRASLPPPEPAELFEAQRLVVPTDGPWKGALKPLVTIVAFSDYQCPYCKTAAAALDRLVERHRDVTRLVAKHLPATRHPYAHLAARIAVAAESQGKFWPLHDRIFVGQDSLDEPRLMAWAAELGLDVHRLRNDAASAATHSRIRSEMRTALKLGAPGTPTIYMNGRRVVPPFGFDRLERALQLELDDVRAARSRGASLSLPEHTTN
jgi:protein-disulfide isomerase